VTGIAGPTGGTPEKPVGLVHYAVAARSGTADRQLNFPGTRQQIRLRSAFAALALLRRVLTRGFE
jgi:nicotinamide-nucleotide amidase